MQFAWLFFVLTATYKNRIGFLTLKFNWILGSNKYHLNGNHPTERTSIGINSFVATGTC
jgi:hypothetical protein